MGPSKGTYRVDTIGCDGVGMPSISVTRSSRSRRRKARGVGQSGLLSLHRDMGGKGCPLGHRLREVRRLVPDGGAVP